MDGRNPCCYVNYKKEYCIKSVISEDVYYSSKECIVLSYCNHIFSIFSTNVLINIDSTES